MKDALAPPEAPPKATFTEFNVRQETGKPHFIRLEDSVVKRLEKELNSTPPGAAAKFGLLLGTADSREQCTIAVEDFEPAAKLDEAIRTWKPISGSRQKIVGYYRSHTRPNFGLDQADLTLFERHFPAESRLALLVKPRTTEVGTAMFFLGQNGRLVFDHATVEFPFNLVELGAEEAPAAAPVAAAMSAPAPKPVAPAPPKPSRGSGLFIKLAAAGIVVIASVFGLNELHVFEHPSAQPAAEATVAENRAEEEVQPPAPAAAPVPEPAAVKPVRANSQPPKALATLPKPPAPIQQTVLPQNTIPSSPWVPPATPVAQAPVSIPPVAPPAPRRSTAPAPVPVTPPVAEERPREIQPTAAPPPPPEPIAKPVEAIPVTPPRVIRQIAPVLSDKVRHTISSEAVVRVKVNVDESGKVISAEPVPGTSASSALIETAVNAVKLWQFEPAIRAGEKVRGDIVLSFTFRK